MDDKKFNEKSLEEIKIDNFRKPNKIYDKMNVSVRQLDIFMVILSVILIFALIMGTR